MLRTLFIEEARTQVGRNASVTGACCLVLLGFLGLWWLLADVPASNEAAVALMRARG